METVPLFYGLVGLALLALTLQSGLSKYPWLNLPAIYIGVGALSAGLGLPYISPLMSETSAKIITHASELIVIISLTGAGLAMDTKMGWRRWQPCWRLLGLTMPLTMVCVIALGLWLCGLNIAGAILLAAVLAPTDPVLARSVQVGPPGDDETDVKGALTAEAGLNDGLAFPFVYLAIAFAAAGSGAGVDSAIDWTSWFSFDVVYRVAMGIGVGWLCGLVIKKITLSDIGDARNHANRAAILMLAATFIAYGLAEAVNGYGFLSVFIAARAGRGQKEVHEDKSQEPESGDEGQRYTRLAHQSADQFEGILMVILLLWFGTFVANELWSMWTLKDLICSMLIIFLIRPLTGYLSLIGTKMVRNERAKIAFFGIRGMGSIYYLAYAQTHGGFSDMETLWRIVGLTILISVVTHETLARHVIPGADSPERMRA